MIGSRWICLCVWTLYKARERFPPFYGSRASSSLTSRAEHLRQIFVKEKKISDDLSEIAETKFGIFFWLQILTAIEQSSGSVGILFLALRLQCKRQTFVTEST